jgi:hypothetical protein
MATTRVTVTMDEGVYRDACDTAAEHGMSVSAWITRCTQLQTMQDAFTRHQAWCAAEGLSGEAHEQAQSQVIADAGGELDRLGEARGGASDAA